MPGNLTAIYTRVSTNRQKDDSQRLQLERWADHAGENVDWYTDSATGTNMARPGVQNLLQHVREGKVRRVVVYRLDRLGRKAREVLEVCEELKARGVELISLTEKIDTATPMGWCLIGIIASLAQLETEVRGERVRDGQAAARARGKRWGGRKPGQVNRGMRTKAEAVLNLHNAGTSVSEIAAVVGIARKTVYAILRREEVPA
jgi:DNA invertase Pin-like site-specific DNA recombinase